MLKFLYESTEKKNKQFRHLPDKNTIPITRSFICVLTNSKLNVLLKLKYQIKCKNFTFSGLER